MPGDTGVDQLYVDPSFAGGVLVEAPEYRYIVANTVDDEVVTELPISNAAFSLVLNGPGSFRGTMPKIDQDGEPTVTQDTLWPNKHSVYILRNNQVLWGGIVSNIQTGLGNQLTVSAEGHVNYLRRRIVPYGKVWSWSKDTDLWDVLEDLIVTKMQTAGVTNDGMDMNIGTGYVPDGASGLLLPATLTYYWYNYPTIAQILDDLSNMEQVGFDYAFEYAFDQLTVQKRLVFFSPRIGSETPAARFEWDAESSTSNIQSYDLNVNGARQANRVTVVGYGDGASSLKARVPSASGWPPSDIGDNWPMLEDVHTMKTINQQNILKDKATRAQKWQAFPTTYPTITFHGTDSEVSPSDIRPGDNVAIYINDYWAQFNITARIATMEVKIDQGTEMVKLGMVEDLDITEI